MKANRPVLYFALTAATIVASYFIVGYLFMFRRFVDEPLHASIEAVGAFAGMMMLYVLSQRQAERYGGKLFLLSMAFLSMGLLDGFHAITAPGDSFVVLHTLAVLTGGLWFVCVWLPEGPVDFISRNKRWIAGSTAAGAGVVWVLSVTLSPLGPALVDGRFTPVMIALNVVAGLLFLGASARLLLDYIDLEQPEIYPLALVALVFGLAGLTFADSSIWGNAWWLWHVLRLAAYLIALSLIFRDFQELLAGLRRAVTRSVRAESELSRAHAELESRVKETTAELAESLEKYRSLVESTSDWVWQVDDAAAYTYSSPQVNDLLGYEPREVIGKTPFDLMPEGEKERVLSIFGPIIAARDSFRLLENTNMHKDGHFVVLETSGTPILDDDGSFRGYRGIDRDITARKQAEAEARESERRFGELLRSVQLIAVMMDARGVITFCNNFLGELSGWKGEELIGADWFDTFIPTVNREEMRRVFIRVLAEGAPVHQVYDITTRDGERRTVRWSNVFLLDGEGKTVGVASIGDDITEREQSRILSGALNDINMTLSSTLDFEQVMEEAIVQSRRAIGSEGAVMLLRQPDGEWSLRYQDGYSWGAVGARFNEKEFIGAKTAVDMKRPIVCDDVMTDHRLNRETMARHNVKSILIAPQVAREEVIGVICFSNHAVAAPFTGAQVDFASKLASYISLAIENARLFRVEKDIADTLQQALITVPPKIHGLEFSYLYRAAVEATDVGGDFFDLFELEHGRVGLVIGDVSGKGLEAAGLTALVKNTLKAYAHQEDSPAVVMAMTNEIVAKLTPSATFVTVFFGVIDIDSGAMRYCSAGHPPPILRRGQAARGLFKEGSIPVGIFSDIDYFNGLETLEKGDLLVLYTDGLTEARRDREFLGEENLIEMIGAAETGDAGALSQLIFDEFMEVRNYEIRDDLALMVVSLDGKQ